MLKSLQIVCDAYIIVSDGEVEACVGSSQPNGFLVIGTRCSLLAVKVPDMHRLAACTHHTALVATHHKAGDSLLLLINMSWLAACTLPVCVCVSHITKLGPPFVSPQHAPGVLPACCEPAGDIP